MARGGGGGSRGGGGHSGGGRSSGSRGGSSSGRSSSSMGRSRSSSSSSSFGRSFGSSGPSRTSGPSRPGVGGPGYGGRPTPPPPPPRPRPPRYFGPRRTHTTVIVHDDGTYEEREVNREGCLVRMIKAVLVIIILAMVLLMVTRLFVHVDGGTGSTSNITISTVDREPLEKKYVTNTGDWYEDDIGWIHNQSTVVKGLKYFYDETGVAPYLILIEQLDGSYSPSLDDLWDYGNQRYDELFEDEGHMVFVFQCRDGGDEYNMTAVTGQMAKTVVDDEALDILYDYVDHYFYSDLDEDNMFAQSFKDAADRMMVKTPNYTPFIVWCICGVISAVVCYFIIKMVIKRRKEEAAETERILNTPIEKIGADDEADELAKKYTGGTGTNGATKLAGQIETEDDEAGAGWGEAGTESEDSDDFMR